MTITSCYYLIRNDFAFTYDILFKTSSFDDTYINPLSRAPPYLVGIGMAYFLVNGNISLVTKVFF